MQVSWLNEKFAAYTPRSNKLTGLRRVYVGTGTVLSVIHLLLTNSGWAVRVRDLRFYQAIISEECSKGK